MQYKTYTGLTNTEAIEQQARQGLELLINALHCENRISTYTAEEMRHFLNNIGGNWHRITLEKVAEQPSHRCTLEVAQNGAPYELIISLRPKEDL